MSSLETISCVFSMMADPDPIDPSEIYAMNIFELRVLGWQWIKKALPNTNRSPAKLIRSRSPSDRS
ncbi:MAG: hypothetical protein Q4D77_07795 [Peptostreptococcaceae bacterium]|nr:hypothetical protein [Peptostreptococcaceae bacterium]